MAELVDGFKALPGGPGMLEEFFEMFTWSQEVKEPAAGSRIGSGVCSC
jgi:predicted Rossmann-fold nucleotide-binding protein